MYHVKPLGIAEALHCIVLLTSYRNSFAFVEVAHISLYLTRLYGRKTANCHSHLYGHWPSTKRPGLVLAQHALAKTRFNLIDHIPQLFFVQGALRCFMTIGLAKVTRNITRFGADRCDRFSCLI